MNKNIFKTISALMMGLAILATSSSCQKEEPTAPTTKTEEINIDAEQARVDFDNIRIRVVGGHLHGKYLFHQDAPIPGMTHLIKIQELKLTEQNGEWKISEDSPSKRLIVRSSEGIEDPQGGAIYGMWIEFYKGNTLVSGELVEGGAQDKHQLFFIPRNVTATEFGKAEKSDNQVDKLFDHLYCDTDPWYRSRHEYDVERTGKEVERTGKEVTFIGEQNPLGLKGHFRFLKKHKKFDLELRLMRSTKALKFGNGNKPSPFYAPSEEQLAKAKWDMVAKIPVHIFISHSDIVDNLLINGEDAGDYTEKEDGTNYTLDEIFEALDKTKLEDYSKKNQAVFRSVMDAFGISFKEVQREFYLQVYGDRPPHTDAGFWF